MWNYKGADMSIKYTVTYYPPEYVEELQLELETQRRRADEAEAEVKRWEDQEVRRGSCCSDMQDRAEKAERSLFVLQEKMGDVATHSHGMGQQDVLERAEKAEKELTDLRSKLDEIVSKHARVREEPVVYCVLGAQANPGCYCRNNDGTCNTEHEWLKGQDVLKTCPYARTEPSVACQEHGYFPKSECGSYHKEAE
jgi:hypothetical protein